MKIILIILLAIGFVGADAQQKANKKQLPIGIFDSGTGGLTVMEAILGLDAFNNSTGQPGADGKLDFENEFYQYLADQANMPYGNYAAVNKTALLKEHVLKNLQFLLNKTFDKEQKNKWGKADKPAVKMVVVACNTATAYVLSDMRKLVKQQNKNVPVIGVIDAGTKAALAYQQKNKGTIAVFATAGTVASNGYPRTLKEMAKQLGFTDSLSIVSQGGLGLAESIDRDFDYYSDTITKTRNAYRGPSFKNKNYTIDTALMDAYHFSRYNNQLLCEYDPQTNNCLDMQLNDPGNYVRYHLVSLVEKMFQQQYSIPLNTIILGCTHYPYMKDTISKVLAELYNYQKDGQYRYRHLLADHIELIDPSKETAKEAYIALHKLQGTIKNKTIMPNTFFISVPNKSLPEVQLQPDGWFTYDYKYGRKEGENKTYVRMVPFDDKNISAATYNRFKQMLPHVYAVLGKISGK